jgi:secreted PhoX family phosphatase
LVYDYGQGVQPSLGGTTTLVYDENKGKLERQFLSLAGTNRNCAGGVTPWNTWLSCEEDMTRREDTVEKDHGYIFEVPATDQVGLVDPVPIVDMGRFNHEAVAVHPKSGVVYQTEDRLDSLVYRYIPREKGKLQAGGRLQVLSIQGQLRFDTRNWEKMLIRPGASLPVEWVDIENDFNPKDDLRYRGFIKGGARFGRGEGMWYANGTVFFMCTNGGSNKLGQVFRYTPSPWEGTDREPEQAPVLELYLESPGKEVLHMGDNITVSPWGDLFICEDNSRHNHIRRVNRQREISTFATNNSSESELTGVCFSPSGKTMFVNIQESGETLAITGPWEMYY